VSLAAGLVLMMVRRFAGKLFRSKGNAKAGTPTALPGGDREAQLEAQRQAQLHEAQELQAQLDAAAFKETTKKAAVLVKRLRDNINKDPVIPAHIVRGWLNEGN
jgi:flagellar biosynthesis/type III secretory pathway M-ring protein FliF/YscJ